MFGVYADAGIYAPLYSLWAVVGRLGATVLVLAVGVPIAYLVALASFSIPQMPVSLGQLLGITVGMEAALGISWGTSVLTGRILDKRRHILGSRDHERRTTRD